MKATGIIAEYNPLHNGHIYHMNRAREITGCDAIVIAMSGDYVQRGEPAMMDKWTRTGHALECGADLVVEIPAVCCLGNAGQYAAAGTGILESMGKVSHIVFGSECGDIDKLIRAAEFLDDNQDKIDALIRSDRYRTLSYPAARARACRELGFGTDLSILDNANDILAIEYIRSMKSAEPAAVRRLGAGYNEAGSEGQIFMSAAGIRELVISGSSDAAADAVSEYVPVCTSDSIAHDRLTRPDEWLGLLKYAVMSSPAEEIEECPSGGEGLGNLMKKKIADAGSWAGFIDSIKSRKYTYTRLSRLCMQVILGIRRSVMPQDGRCGYIRVLGMNDTGRRLLAEMRSEECASAPVITNINKRVGYLGSHAEKMLELDIHAADIYNLITGRENKNDSDHVRIPVLK